MKLNTPLPQSLPKECAKAAKIFNSFVDSGNNGLDGVIPRGVLENAKGFAIFTIFKAGFLFSARAGSGIVIAKLDDGTWCAPSAIGTAGLGVGGQVGAEMTDFLVVLNSRSAVRSFMSAGSLTLGGNMSIAMGPLGRNGEATGSISSSGKMAAMYSYSKTRGLFGGVSVEGSVIVERQDANAQAYRSDVSAKQLLSGSIDPPEWSSSLIKTLERCTGMPGGRQWVNDDDNLRSDYAFGGFASPENGPSRSVGQDPLMANFSGGGKHSKKNSFPPSSWGKKKDSGSYFDSEFQDDLNNTSSPPSKPYESSRSLAAADPFSGSSNKFETHFDSDFSSQEQQHMKQHARFGSSTLPGSNAAGYGVTNGGASSYAPSPLVDFGSTPSPATQSIPHARSMSVASPFSGPKSPSTNPFSSMAHQRSASLAAPPPYIQPKPELATPLSPKDGVARAIALYHFQAVESGDLSFNKGEVITIIEKSDSSDDWWTGRVNGKQGIFPANFVEVV